MQPRTYLRVDSNRPSRTTRSFTRNTRKKNNDAQFQPRHPHEPGGAGDVRELQQHLDPASLHEHRLPPDGGGRERPQARGGLQPPQEGGFSGIAI